MKDTDLFITKNVNSTRDVKNVVIDKNTSIPDIAYISNITRCDSSACHTSLSSIVLSELRSLAKEIGIEGASSLRKSHLVEAIRTYRSKSNNIVRTSSQNSINSLKSQTDVDLIMKDKYISHSGSGKDFAYQSNVQDINVSKQNMPRIGLIRPANEIIPTIEKTVNNKDLASKSLIAKSQENIVKHESYYRNKKFDPNYISNNDRNALEEEKNQKPSLDQTNDQPEHQENQRIRNTTNSYNNDNDGDNDCRQVVRRGGRRFRDRDRRRRSERITEVNSNNETELREDDVIQPVAGILDVLDNYAFVRTSGYLAGPSDVYVSMNMVRKNGLRRGDAIVGAVRIPRDNEGSSNNPRQKFNPLVRLDKVNNGSIESAKHRPDFTKLTPLYPNQRLRLETISDRLTTRVIDLIMPIGKGQRALIVSPPKAGKTTIMQNIANAITINNPECHLMVVLVDERPEEVTDMQRSVNGEVIASTFDRPPSDHTQAAELAIERAKRLVEQNMDVVVLLDSITRLGRAYNNSSPASGRILSGGVDSTALYPPKRFLGAARNIEHGGSLTIIATAMIETGSTGDTVIFEEFKGTGNAELKLDRKIAERRVFPAVDINPSGTRKDELLLSPDEFAIIYKLRRVLSGLDSHQAVDLVLNQLRKTKNNYEFLGQVSKTTPGSISID